MSLEQPSNNTEQDHTREKLEDLDRKAGLLAEQLKNTDLEQLDDDDKLDLGTKIQIIVGVIFMLAGGFFTFKEALNMPSFDINNTKDWLSAFVNVKPITFTGLGFAQLCFAWDRIKSMKSDRSKK